MAPKHGKETGADGENIHDVSEARVGLLIDNGLKRTFPLTKKSTDHSKRSKPGSVEGGSRLSQNVGVKSSLSKTMGNRADGSLDVVR